jgi:hypothetical protein
VITTNQKYSLSENTSTGSNPFMPKMPTRKKNQGGPPG